MARFDQLTTDNGLIHNSITCLMQDSKGYMWIGTEHGLDRYDGYNFKQFIHDPSDNFSISNNIILNLFEDNENIWVMTDNGINIFNRKTEKFSLLKIKISGQKNTKNNHKVLTIKKDKNGSLWLGGIYRGLIRYNPKDKTYKMFLNNKSDKSKISFPYAITSLTIDKNEILWFGTNTEGLNRFNPKNGKFTKFLANKHNPDSLSNNSITSIYEDSKGILWIGTHGGGLNRFDKKTKKFTYYPLNGEKTSGIEPIYITAIIEDRNRDLWIGTKFRGINRLLNYKNKKFIKYTRDPLNIYSLNNNTITALNLDKTGNIWIGTEFGGLNLYKPQKQNFSSICFNLKHSKNINNMTAVLINKKEDLWLGTKFGLYFLNSKGFNRKSSINILGKDNTKPLASGHLTTIYEDSYGDVWFGILYHGLKRINKKTNITLNYPFIPESNLGPHGFIITAIIEDSDKNLWITTYNNVLNMYERQKNNFIAFKNKNVKNSEKNINLTLANGLIDKNKIWIGTSNGLSYFNKKNKQFKNLSYKFGTRSSLNSNKVYSIYISPNNPEIIWIGTENYGLHKFNITNKKWRYYRKNNGLNDNSITNIIEDNNNLWLGTNKGLSKFNIKDESFENFHEHDGAQSNGYYSNTCLKDKNGYLYFGGTKGISYFLPKKLKKNKYVPDILITDFLVFNKKFPLKESISEIKEINLQYNDNMFSFKFSSMDFTNPEKNQYAYKLDGFDKKWIYTESSNRVATFTNIPHGEYIFRVKGSNNDGIWNDQGVSIKITIIPPFWKTIWFKSFIIILFFLLIFYFYKQRIKKLEEKMGMEIKVNKVCIRYGITEREKEILDLIIKGKSNKEIEGILFIALGTVKNHVHNILSKFDVKSRNEIILKFNKGIDIS